MNKVYNVGELKKLIAESSTEIKKVLGKGVEEDNRKNSDKAYKESEKKVNGGLKGNKDWVRGNAKYEKKDANHTTLGYNPENVSKEYKDRVKALALGFSSKENMDNHKDSEDTSDYSKNKEIFNVITDNEKEMDDNVKNFKHTGLQASQMPVSTFEKETMYESKDGFDMRKMITNLSEHVSALENVTPRSNKPIKTVFYKKTEFISEQHMLSKIPDEFKTDGTVLKMKDKTGNEYVVEWRNNSGKILEHKNKHGWDDSVNKMKYLFEYKTKTNESNHETRLNENDNTFENVLNIVRQKNKQL